MSLTSDTLRLVNTFNRLRAELANRYVGRRRTIALLMLATVCREHLLLIGPPGTGKTGLVQRYAERLTATWFTYLLSRFTEPSEIFGPLDFEQFQKGTYQIRTDGMLPDAQIAFLDEVFHGSSAILNTLLTLINERMFHNGAQVAETPLVTLIGAANELPADPGLAAFADRFLLRDLIAPIAGGGPDGPGRGPAAPDDLSALLDAGWRAEIDDHVRRTRPDQGRATGVGMVGIDEVAGLTDQLFQVDVEAIQPVYRDVIRELLAAEAPLSDRRIVRGMKLVCGAALLDGTDAPRERHLWPLAHIWTAAEDAGRFAEIVQARVEADGGEPLDPPEPAEDIAARARQEAKQVLTADRPAGYAMGVEEVLATMTGLNRELATRHPARTDLIQEIDRLIEAVMERLDEAGRID